MGTRDQWKSMITIALRKRLEEIKASKNFSKLLTLAKNDMLSRDGNLQAYVEYISLQKEHDRLSKERDAVQKKQNEVYRILNNKYPDTVSGRYDSLESRIESAAINSLANDKNLDTVPEAAEVVKLLKLLKNLDFQFLLATTPRQLRETAENLIAQVGMKLEDLC